MARAPLTLCIRHAGSCYASAPIGRPLAKVTQLPDAAYAQAFDAMMYSAGINLMIIGVPYGQPR